MITTPQEYFEKLHLIQNTNFPEISILIPSTENVYKIDLNSRTVETPEFLSVQYDHLSETIYFLADRYFDNIDLANTTCVVQYINADNEGRVYAVPFYDITTYPGKILIPWCIEGEATKSAGNIKYSFRFYETERDENTKEIVFKYSLNTLTTQSKILHGMYITRDEDDYVFSAEVLDDVYKRINDIEQLCWVDAF